VRSAIRVYGIHKVVRRDVGEERAIEFVSALRAATVVPLDESLALETADISLEHGLVRWPMPSSSRRRRGIGLTSSRRTPTSKSFPGDAHPAALITIGN